MKLSQSRHLGLATETAWVFAGQGASAIAAFVGLRLVTEMVPPEIFGAVALALGLVTLAHGLTVGPVMQAVLRYYPDLARAEREMDLRRATLLALRKPALLTLTAFTTFGVGWSFWFPDHACLIALSIALFVAEAARAVEVTFLNAARRQRAMALLVGADAWLRPILAVVLVLAFGANSAAVLAGYLVGCIVALVTFRLTDKARQVRVIARVAPQGATDISRNLWKYALPLTALPLIGWVSGQADRYLVGGLVGVADAGLYAALYGLASKPFLIFSATVELALRQPYYASVSVGDHTAERGALLLWLTAVTTVSLVLWLLFVFFHGSIAAFLLAAEYRSNSALMLWIAAGYVWLSIAQVLQRVCYAYHDTHGVLWIEAIAAALSILIAAPLVYAYGIEGAAWGVPLYFGAQLLAAMVRARSVWLRAKSSAPVAAAPQVTPTGQ